MYIMQYSESNCKLMSNDVLIIGFLVIELQLVLFKIKLPLSISTELNEIHDSTEVIEIRVETEKVILCHCNKRKHMYWLI